MTEHKNIQVNLELEEKALAKMDEIDNYLNNINYFIVGGRMKSAEWITYIITDVMNSKLRADFEDI